VHTLECFAFEFSSHIYFSYCQILDQLEFDLVKTAAGKRLEWAKANAKGLVTDDRTSIDNLGLGHGGAIHASMPNSLRSRRYSFVTGDGKSQVKRTRTSMHVNRTVQMHAINTLEQVKTALDNNPEWLEESLVSSGDEEMGRHFNQLSRCLSFPI
jgi:hypothetical protein